MAGFTASVLARLVQRERVERVSGVIQTESVVHLSAHIRQWLAVSLIGLDARTLTESLRPVPNQRSDDSKCSNQNPALRAMVVAKEFESSNQACQEQERKRDPAMKPAISVLSQGSSGTSISRPLSESVQLAFTGQALQVGVIPAGTLVGVAPHPLHGPAIITSSMA